MDNKTIEASWNEIKPIVRILNEVCHGIPIQDFEDEIGYTYDQIYALLKKIKNSKPETETDRIQLSLTPRELDILQRSYDASLNYLDAWDFPIRIGITLEESQKLLQALF